MEDGGYFKQNTIVNIRASNKTAFQEQTELSTKLVNNYTYPHTILTGCCETTVILRVSLVAEDRATAKLHYRLRGLELEIIVLDNRSTYSTGFVKSAVFIIDSVPKSQRF